MCPPSLIEGLLPRAEEELRCAQYVVVTRRAARVSIGRARGYALHAASCLTVGDRKVASCLAVLLGYSISTHGANVEEQSSMLHGLL